MGADAEEFLAHAWLESRHLAAQNMGRLSALVEHHDLADLNSICRVHRGASIVAQRRNSSGQREALPIDADAVGSFLRSGYTVVFERLDRSIPAIAEICTELLASFGLSEDRGGCNLFMTPPAGGIYKHFDDKDVWVVGLRGNKQFSVAENHEFPNPTTNSMTPTNDWKALQLMEFSDEMPSNATIVDVGPGTTLYIPPGHWHATSSADGASSLSFGLRRPSWRDLVVSHLATELLADPEWRAFVPFMGETSAPGMERRIADLRLRLGQWSASDVLEGHSLVRRAGISRVALNCDFDVVISDDTILIRDGDTETLIECDDVVRSLVQILQAAPTGVSFDELATCSPLTHDELTVALRALSQVDVIRLE